ncbi:MAG: hypothetical protein P8X89_00510 [Reinekea sp.]
MGAPAIFEKQIEIKLLHPASTLESRIQVRHYTSVDDSDFSIQTGCEYDIDVVFAVLPPVRSFPACET